MSEQKEQQGGTGKFTGTAARALVSAAAAGAATYAVRKALSRNGDDHSEGEVEDNSPVSQRYDSGDPTDDENDEETDETRTDDDDDDDDASENAAEDDDEEDDGDSEPQARGTDRSRGVAAGEAKLKSVTSSALASASHALIPVAEGAADAAGRYVAEHAPDAVRDKLVPHFIEAFEKAN